MPLFSAFTPFGLLELSAQPSRAESIYRSIVAQQGGDGVNFSFAEGSRQDCTAYAQAMGLARASWAVAAAGNQMAPLKTTWMLNEREKEYGLFPAPTDTMTERRLALYARRQLPAGCSTVALTSALSTLMGSDFIALRATASAERLNWPTSLGDQPMNLRAPDEFPKPFRILECVSITGITQRIDYEITNAPISIKVTRNVGPRGAASQEQATVVSIVSTPGALLQVGDFAVIGADNTGTAEVVEVTAVSPAGADPHWFEAIFTNAHDPNALCRTGPFPLWTSNQRSLLVVMTPEAAVDPEKRRKVHELMNRAAHATTSWDIAASSDGVTTGPFTLDLSPLDATTFDVVTFP